MRGLDCNGWLRIWWWFRRSASAAQFRARWYHCCHFILLSCCLSFFLVFSCFFVISLPICLLFIVTLSFLVLFWFAGFGSAAPPKTYFLATVESVFATFSVIWCHLFFMCLQFVCHVCAIFCRFMPLLLLDWLVFELSETKLNDKKSHDEWQRPNEKEMTKTWHLFDNPQSVLARCSQQIVGQSHVYKWCQHQPQCAHMQHDKTNYQNMTKNTSRNKHLGLISSVCRPQCQPGREQFFGHTENKVESKDISLALPRIWPESHSGSTSTGFAVVRPLAHCSIWKGIMLQGWVHVMVKSVSNRGW